MYTEVYQLVLQWPAEESMKTASVRDLREHIAEHLDGSEPVFVTRNGRHVGVLFPINELKKLPVEYRRKLFLDLTSDIAKQLDTNGVTKEDLERDFAAHKKHRRR